MSAFKYFTKIDLVHARSMRATPMPSLVCESLAPRDYAMPSLASVTRKEVKARVATSGLCFYRPSTVGHSQAVQIMDSG